MRLIRPSLAKKQYGGTGLYYLIDGFGFRINKMYIDERYAREQNRLRKKFGQHIWWRAKRNVRA